MNGMWYLLLAIDFGVLAPNLDYSLYLFRPGNRDAPPYSRRSRLAGLEPLCNPGQPADNFRERGQRPFAFGILGAGTCLRTLLGHNWAVLRVCVTPDGQQGDFLRVGTKRFGFGTWRRGDVCAPWPGTSLTWLAWTVTRTDSAQWRAAQTGRFGCGILPAANGYAPLRPQRGASRADGNARQGQRAVWWRLGADIESRDLERALASSSLLRMRNRAGSVALV